jgi:Domain of unknown function (DUF4337)
VDLDASAAAGLVARFLPAEPVRKKGSMSAIEELKEHMEHAAHESGGHGPAHKAGPGRNIGVTMATLGVMLAVCAAYLGSERTELVRTMVEQSNKLGVYQAETTKYRVIQADYELLKSISPKKDEIEKIDKTLRSKRSPSGKADDEDTAELKDLIASGIDDLADLLSPDPEEKDRFAKLAEHYKRDMAEAKEDAEAYDLKIKAHEEGAEGYERAQLGAEIGIVVASVALLLSNKKVWIVSVVLGAFCAAVGLMTFMHTHALLAEADKKIAAAASNMVAIEKDDESEDAPAGKEPAKGEPGKVEPAKGEPKHDAPKHE